MGLAATWKGGGTEGLGEMGLAYLQDQKMAWGLLGCSWPRKGGPEVRPPTPSKLSKGDKTWRRKVMRGLPNFLPSSGTALPSTRFHTPELKPAFLSVLI